MDTTNTKIFVGGLAWETQSDTMRRYFEQFGEIYEAVVITDKHTGRSKGYGFLTFMDPEAAARACENPSPVIDGRKANCNLAILGANRPYPQFPTHPHGIARFRPPAGQVLPPAYHGSSNYSPRSEGQFLMPYSAYRYLGYSQNAMYPPVGYFGGYESQQYSSYYPTRAPGHHSTYPTFYPFYGHYGMQYPPNIVQSHYLQRSPNPAPGILALPSNLMPTPTTVRVSMTATSATQSSDAIASEQDSST